MEPIDIADPYDSCERGRCNHDLARAVGIAELWGADGPHPAGAIVVRLNTPLDGPEEYLPDLVAEQQRWAV